MSVYTNMDIVMLGIIRTDQDVGYYNAAVKVKVVLLGLVASLGGVLLPRMSCYVKEKKSAEFQEIMLKSINITMLMAIPLCTYFIIFASETLSFLAGNGYNGAVLAMQIINISVIPNAISGILGGQVLTALEKEIYVLYSAIAGAIADLILNLIFIPKYGAAGAAFATVIAEFVVLIVQVCYIKDMLKRIYKDFRLGRYIISAMISALIVIAISFLDFQHIFLQLLFAAIVFFGIYVGILYVSKEKLVVELISLFLNKIKGDRC